MFEQYREITANQAHQLSIAIGKPRSVSFLVRCASKGIIKARKGRAPVGLSFWMIDKAALLEYLSTEHKPGPKPGSKRKKQELVEA